MSSTTTKVSSDGDPLVSVIITTRNRSNYLKDAVNSVMAQSYSPLEVIVVNDASTDDTSSVLESFKNNGLICIENENRLGVSKSRNKGDMNSKGQFIAFLDDDDKFYPDKIAEQMQALINSKQEVGLCLCGYQRVMGTHVLGSIIPTQQIIYRARETLRRRSLPAPSMQLWRKEKLIELNGFDGELEPLEDWDLLLRFSSQYEIILIPEILVDLRIHGKQASSDIERLVSGLSKLINKHADLYDKNRVDKSYLLRRMAVYQIFLNKKLEALRSIGEAILLNPLNPKFWLQLSLFLLPIQLHKLFLKKIFFRKYGGAEYYT